MAQRMIIGMMATRPHQIFIKDELGNCAEILPWESQRLRKHSPDGFNWGYGGSGPAQLALALLLHYRKDKYFSVRWYQDFKWEVIASLPQTDFEIPEKKVTDWIELKKGSHEKICEKSKRM